MGPYLFIGSRGVPTFEVDSPGAARVAVPAKDDDCHLYWSYANEVFTRLETKPERLAETTGIDGDITQVFKRLGTDTYVLMYDVYGLRPSNMGFSETTDFVTYRNLGRFNEGSMKTTNFTSPKHGAVTYLTLDELKAAAAHWKVEIKLN